MSLIFKIVILSLFMFPAISRGQSFEQLKCFTPESQSSPEVSAVAAPDDVEAVPVCPDCETLKAKGDEAALSIPRELYARDEAQRLADYNLTKKYLIFDSSPKQLQTKVDQTKSRLALMKACAKSKWSRAAKPAFEKYLDSAKKRCSSPKFLPENEDVKSSVTAMDRKRRPSREDLNNFCHVWANMNFNGGTVTDWKPWFVKRIPGLEAKLKEYRDQLAKVLSTKNATKIPNFESSVEGTGVKECNIKYEEYRAIQRYTANFYGCLNRTLRGEESGCIKPKELHAVMRIINRGLTKIAPHLGEVYRGIRDLPENVLAAHQEGAIVQFSSYLSTTASKEVSFAGMYQYVIQSKTGRLVAPISGIPSEQEVLFAPMAKFKVTKIEDHPDELNGKIFYLEEI